ncbi:MAG: hypothetical protein RLZZ262_1228 [Bacteroidota bacterium]|jgi:hypothetical protein
MAKSPKYVGISAAVFLFVVVFAFLFFRKNQIAHQRETKELIGKELYGKIKILENMNRGSYDLKIDNYEIRSLPIAFEIQQYNIQVGDSMSKEANSNIIKFYKIKNGTFEKCFDYEIRM